MPMQFKFLKIKTVFHQKNCPQKISNLIGKNKKKLKIIFFFNYYNDLGS